MRFLGSFRTLGRLSGVITTITRNLLLISALAGQQLRFELLGLPAGTAPASGHRHRQWRVYIAITNLLSGTIAAGLLYDFIHK